MKLTVSINYLHPTHSGKPTLRFSCTDCKRWFADMSGPFYQAQLKADQRSNPIDACKEFVQRVNAHDFDLFKHSKSAVRLQKALCRCHSSNSLRLVGQKPASDNVVEVIGSPEELHCIPTVSGYASYVRHQ